MSTSDSKKAEFLSEDYNQYDLSFKMIIIGDAGVGKSCLTTKAAKGVFDETYSATVGFEFLTFNVRIDGKVIKLQIWDTCGQEIYRSLISSFYRNASIAMMVYSIESKESFNHMETWLKEIKLQSNPDIKIFLIGNKADLEDQREVTSNEAEKFREENGIHYFGETSAKSGLNTKEVFIEAAKLLYNEHLKYKVRANKNSNVGNNKIPIKINKNQPERKQGCC